GSYVTHWPASSVWPLVWERSPAVRTPACNRASTCARLLSARWRCWIGVSDGLGWLGRCLVHLAVRRRGQWGSVPCHQGRQRGVQRPTPWLRGDGRWCGCGGHRLLHRGSGCRWQRTVQRRVDEVGERGRVIHAG